jgi:hypothetical protein
MATGLIERAAIIRENHEFWVVLLAKAFIPIGKLPVKQVYRPLVWG